MRLTCLRVLPSLFIAASLCAQTPAPAPNPTPAPAPTTTTPRVLTLDDCVALALNKNFDLKIQRLSTDNARDSLIIADAVYDPALEASAARSYAQSRDGVTSQSGFDTRIGASQNLITGGRISTSAAIDRTRSRPFLTGTLNPVYNSDVTLSVRQPLLKNAGLAANRANIDRAKLGVTRAGYDLKDQVLITIRDVESAYYNLAFARAQLEVRRFSLEVAERLSSENRERRTAGNAIDLDVLQADVGTANARRALLQAEQNVRDREDLLISLINPFDFAVAPGPLTLSELGPIKVSFDRSYKLARDQAPALASSNLTIEQSKLDVLVAKKDRLPILDVGAALGYNAREDTYRRAASHTWLSQGYDWQVDATLSFPWGLRADKARYRQALSGLSRDQLRLQQLEQDLLVDVRFAVRTVETNDESVRIAALATRLSADQYEAEKSRFDAGLSTFRRVQEAKEDYDTSRISELQAQVTLRNALADLARLEASSLGRYKISLAP